MALFGLINCLSPRRIIEQRGAIDRQFTATINLVDDVNHGFRERLWKPRTQCNPTNAGEVYADAFESEILSAALVNDPEFVLILELLSFQKGPCTEFRLRILRYQEIAYPAAPDTRFLRN